MESDENTKITAAGCGESVTKAAEGGQGFRSHFICLKKGTYSISFNMFCLLSLETIHSEELIE